MTAHPQPGLVSRFRGFPMGLALPAPHLGSFGLHVIAVDSASVGSRSTRRISSRNKPRTRSPPNSATSSANRASWTSDLGTDPRPYFHHPKEREPGEYFTTIPVHARDLPKCLLRGMCSRVSKRFDCANAGLLASL